MQAIGISVGEAEYSEFKEKLGVLLTKKNSLERKLEISRSMAKSSQERAMKGEDFYQDIKEE